MESRDEYLKIVVDYWYDGNLPEIIKKVEYRFESELDWLGGLSGYFLTIYPPEVPGGVSSAHCVLCAIDEQKTRMVITNGFFGEDVDIVDFYKNGKPPVEITITDPNLDPMTPEEFLSDLANPFSYLVKPFAVNEPKTP